MRAYPLKFRPIPQERIWGGSRLAPMFQLDTEKKIGEVWTLSDHPSAPSECVNGEWKGYTFSHILQRDPDEYLGQAWSGQRFPLLIKFLHAEDDLSVQIHPDDDYAEKHEKDFGKTEAWYILDADPGAKINYGHTFQHREDYFRAIEDKRVPDYLQYEPVTAGDFFFVPSRTLHALLKGTMVVEIQQTSDVTYRVYDWDRVNDKGESRTLHVDKAADVMRFSSSPEPPQRQTLRENESVVHQRLVQCPYFSIEKLDYRSATPYELRHVSPDNPSVLVVLEGEGVLRDPNGTRDALHMEQGDTVVVPVSMSDYTIEGNVSLLRTYYASSPSHK